MTCKDIIETYLKEHGYDGLANNGCGCDVNDLAPCNGGPCWDCEPAYKVKGRESDIYVSLNELRKRYVEPDET